MKYRSLMVMALATLLAACASTPDYPRLERARAAIEQAQANPLVAEYAPAALAQAKDAYTRAQASIADNQPKETKHLAYLAERRAQIAVAKAQAAKAREAAKEAKIERRQTLQNQAVNASQRSAQAQAKARAARARAAKARAETQATRSELATLQDKLANLHPKKTSQGIVLTLGDVLFGFDKSALKPSAKPTLDEMAEFLRKHSDARVVINGYTDSVGSRAYNQRLSEARAESVASALERRGITSARLTTHGYGESNPIATNATEEGRTKNRRVEFIIRNVGG